MRASYEYEPSQYAEHTCKMKWLFGVEISTCDVSEQTINLFREAPINFLPEKEVASWLISETDHNIMKEKKNLV